MALSALLGSGHARRRKAWALMGKPTLWQSKDGEARAELSVDERRIAMAMHGQAVA